MDDLARELVLDHARNRRNWALLHPRDFDHEEQNPICGDRLRLTLRWDGEQRISAVGWDGEGCAICLASASMLGEQLLGMPLDQALQLDKQHVLDNIGMPLNILRVKCALLPLKTLIIGSYGSMGGERWVQVERG